MRVSWLPCAAGAVVELSSGERLPCKAVVGCDGVKSRIAASLGLKPASYAGEVYYRSAQTFALGKLLRL